MPLGGWFEAKLYVDASSSPLGGASEVTHRVNTPPLPPHPPPAHAPQEHRARLPPVSPVPLDRLGRWEAAQLQQAAARKGLTGRDRAGAGPSLPLSSAAEGESESPRGLPGHGGFQKHGRQRVLPGRVPCQAALPAGAGTRALPQPLPRQPPQAGPGGGGRAVPALGAPQGAWSPAQPRRGFDSREAAPGCLSGG